MRYPVAIEAGDQRHAFGVVVPDLPGCFSAGDTLDEALENTAEAILLWLEDRAEAGASAPEPRTLDQLVRLREFRGWTWALVDVDVAKISGPAERVNITIPRRALDRIDAAARTAGESRSAYLVRSALTAAASRDYAPGAAEVPRRAARKAHGGARSVAQVAKSRAPARGRRKSAS